MPLINSITAVGQKTLFEQGENFLFTGLHLLRLRFAAPLMIVTKQMKDTVQQQKSQFMLHRDGRFGSILGSALRRDHHVSKQHGRQPAPFTFLHGKGNNIGRPVALQILAIDLLNPGIIENQDRQFRLRKSRDA